MQQDANAALNTFVDRWVVSSSAERANYQLFLAELCDLLNVERPAPTTSDDSRNTYVFEKAVTNQQMGARKNLGHASGKRNAVIH